VDETRVLDLLILARAFLESGWCKGSEATDKQGRAVWPGDDSAVSFCLWGGLFRAWFELRGTNIYDACRDQNVLARTVVGLVSTVAAEKHGDVLHRFNDNPLTTKRRVLALFDAACEHVGKS
jgi:hypothetical protein